jgi:carbamoyltransferase
VAAVEEERLSQHKHDSAFPARSIEFCLKQAGLRMAEVDFIAFPEEPFRTGPDSYLAGMDLELVRRIRTRRKTSLRNVVHKRILDVLLEAGISLNIHMNGTVANGFAQLRRLYGKLPSVRFYDHHQAHAGTAYLTSGLASAAIATMDYSGGPYSSVTWSGQRTKITWLRSEGWHNSLG